ncbi:MAG: hypothetical protein GF329_20695 [Candidatus Lokiarchaeota archaeon]|nr:hypothetical protein [Candidatus Lokiarchaeota archaeon]
MDQKIRKNIQIFLIILGSIISISGVIINSIPSKIKANDLHFNNIDASETHTLHIDQPSKVFETDLDIFLYVLVESSKRPNCTLYVLSKIEYDKFINGSSLDALTYLEKLKSDNLSHLKSNSSIISGSYTFSYIGKLYIVVLNNGTSSIDGIFKYFYTYIHPFYFFGLFILFIGLFIIFFILIWRFKGWKRIFIIGTEINLILFLARIILMTDALHFDILNLWGIFDIRIFRDFEFYYLGWTEAFKAGSALYTESFFSYPYGPLFILILGAFSLLPLSPWIIALPIFLSVVGNGYLVYKIAFKITNNQRFGIYALIIYFLNPFILFYCSFGWLNTSLFTFFMLISFYLILQEKVKTGLIILGVAVMVKQFAIILAPIEILIILKQNRDSNLHSLIEKFLITSLYLILPIALISLPFLIINFQNFIGYFYLSGTIIPLDKLIYLHGNQNAPISFTTFFLFMNFPENIIFIIAFMLQYYILLGSSFFLIYLFYWKSKLNNDYHIVNHRTYNFSEAIYYAILLILAFQLFYPRGTYKYYLVFLVPFIAINYDIDQNLKFKSEKKELTFTKMYFVSYIFSWIIFLCPKYFYLIIIFFWIVFYIIYKKKIIDLNN